MIVLRPVPFALQFLVGVGVPLLVLAAAALAAFPPVARSGPRPPSPRRRSGPSRSRSPSARPGTSPRSGWPPRVALRGACRAGESLVAPADIGRYAGGLRPALPTSRTPARPATTSAGAGAPRSTGSAIQPAGAAFLDRACADARRAARPPPSMPGTPATRRSGTVALAGRHPPRDRDLLAHRSAALRDAAVTRRAGRRSPWPAPWPPSPPSPYVCGGVASRRPAPVSPAPSSTRTTSTSTCPSSSRPRAAASSSRTSSTPRRTARRW